MTVEPRHLTIERRVRYAVLEAESGRIEQLWFVLHGYGQLAHRFVRDFEGLADGSRHIVAPEGLHRYYLDHAERRVGASWMTSEDRLTDIDDYVAYLDRLYDTTLGEIALADDPPPVVALGFSQGVHTLCRWLAFGRSHIDRAILWGAVVPPDLDLEAHGAALAAADLHLVVGTSDEYFGPDAVRRHEARLEAASVPFRARRFEGGHRLDGETLEGVARLPSPR